MGLFTTLIDGSSSSLCVFKFATPYARTDEVIIVKEENTTTKHDKLVYKKNPYVYKINSCKKHINTV